jgi:hypothetical protein
MKPRFAVVATGWLAAGVAHVSVNAAIMRIRM